MNEVRSYGTLHLAYKYTNKYRYIYNINICLIPFKDVSKVMVTYYCCSHYYYNYICKYKFNNQILPKFANSQTMQVFISS